MCNRLTLNSSDRFPQFTMPPSTLLNALLSQVGGPSALLSQVGGPSALISQLSSPIPTSLQGQSPVSQPPSQTPKGKGSKGIKAYPNGWRKVLNYAKVIMRSTVLITQPFPPPGKARVTANECFHEALTVECEDGANVEPGMSLFKEKPLLPTGFSPHGRTGFSWSVKMETIVSCLFMRDSRLLMTAQQLLNELSTCRSDVKKLAKILVASDSELFPASANESFDNKTTIEIRAAAAKALKKSGQSHSPHDPSRIRTLIEERLTNFSFLNDPPTDEVRLLYFFTTDADYSTGSSRGKSHTQDPLQELLRGR